jgi:nucleoside permease NupC
MLSGWCSTSLSAAERSAFTVASLVIVVLLAFEGILDIVNQLLQGVTVGARVLHRGKAGGNNLCANT